MLGRPTTHPSRPILALLVAVAISVSCVPVELATDQALGRWRVSWRCGTEVLEFRGDGTFTQQATWPLGTQTHTGSWRIRARTRSLEGARVILDSAWELCPSGYELTHPRLVERSLSAHWEWGRLVLQFHPDIEPFVRETL